MYSLTGGSDQVLFGEGGVTRAERLVSILSPQLPKDFSGSIIDIGCGTGGFLQAFGKQFPKSALYGREIDDKNLHYLQRIANFKKLYIDATFDAGQGFDVVTSIHCFEHIFDYRSFFDEIKNVSKTSTKILLQMPDVEASPFDIAIADHAAHFSKKTLAYCLRSYREDFVVSAPINKELTAISGSSQKNDAPDTPAIPEDCVRTLDTHVQYLTRLLENIDEQNESEFGVYGTTIAGAWLTGIHKDKISFYVDDDPLKQGKEFFGKKIIPPAQIPDFCKVVMPFGITIRQKILTNHPILASQAIYCEQ